jgi:hypothetical protein
MVVNLLSLEADLADARGDDDRGAEVEAAADLLLLLDEPFGAKIGSIASFSGTGRPILLLRKTAPRAGI